MSGPASPTRTRGSPGQGPATAGAAPGSLPGSPKNTSVHEKSQQQPASELPTLSNTLMRKIGGISVLLAVVSLLALGLTFAHTFLANAELRGDWESVRDRNRALSASAALGSQNVSAAVATAFAQLAYTVSFRVAATFAPLVDTSMTSAPLLAASVDMRSTVAAAASQTTTLRDLFSTQAFFLQSRLVAQQLESVSVADEAHWCTAEAATTSTVVVCIERAAGATAAQATAYRYARPASITSVPAEQLGIHLGTLVTDAALSVTPTEATRMAVAVESNTGSADPAMLDSRVSGLIPLGTGSAASFNVSLRHLRSILTSTAETALNPAACATRNACGSFIVVLDSTTQSTLLADGFTDAVAQTAVNLPPLSRAVARDVALSNTTPRISPVPNYFFTGMASSHASRYPIPVNSRFSVIVGLDPREASEAAIDYADAALSVVDTSMLAAYCVLGITVVLIASLAGCNVAMASRLGRALTEPLERIANDFRYAGNMRLHMVTVYHNGGDVEEDTGSVRKADGHNTEHSGTPGASPRRVPSASPSASPRAAPAARAQLGSSASPRSGAASPSSPLGDTLRSQQRFASEMSLGANRAAPPVEPFSEFVDIAVVQQRCNAMAVALDRCAKYIPRSVLRAFQQPVLTVSQQPTRDSGHASPQSSHHHASPSAASPLPDVADVFGPRASTVNDPPRIELLGGETPPDAGDVSASGGVPPGLETFQFGLPADDSPRDDPLDGSSPPLGDLEFGLRRGTASVVHLTFGGFLKLAQDLSLQEAHSVSQVFLTVAVRIIERHSGVVVHVAADKITAAWNAFSPVTSHESRAAACAFDLRTALTNSEQDMWLPDLLWCAVVTSGDVVVGNSGTDSDRAPVLQGPCVDVAQELPPLLIAIGCQVVVSETVRSAIPAMRDRSTPWHTVPVDRVTLADQETEMTVYELRRGASPKYLAQFEEAFEALMDGRCSEARLSWNDIVEQSMLPEQRGGAAASLNDTTHSTEQGLSVDHQAMRLMKLAALFGSLGVSYVRALPAWQRFEFDAIDQDEATPARERRQVAEKRKSIMPDDVLRTELMNLHNMRMAKGSSPKASMNQSRRKSSVSGANAAFLNAGDSTRAPRRPSVAFAEDAVKPPANLDTNLLSASGSGADGPPMGASARGRRMSKKPFTDSATFTLNAAAAASATPAIALAGPAPEASPPTSQATSPHHATAAGGSPHRPPPGPAVVVPLRPAPSLLAGVTEFRDRKNMLFRVSRHLLGRGAAGEVLLGLSETGCLVAVKTVPIPKQAAGVEGLSPMQRRRMKRKGINVSTDVMVDVENLLTEVSMLARLRDDHIVGYLSSAILEESSKLAVVMEYISGGSLNSLLKEFEGMPLRTVKRYLRDILKGLVFLHGNQIIHRDLKPHNVLLLIDGSCKLTDFGTSCNIGKIAGTTDIAGTPQYMSPEACRGEKLETSSDIWSFGVLMAQLVTGDLPWPDDGMYVPIRFMYQVGHIDTFVPTFPEGVSCPDAARDIILECCQRDPTARPTAEELLSRPFFAAAPTPMRSTRPSRASSQRSRMSGDRSPSGRYSGLGLTPLSTAHSPNSRAQDSGRVSPGSSDGRAFSAGNSLAGGPAGLLPRADDSMLGQSTEDLIAAAQAAAAAGDDDSKPAALGPPLHDGPMLVVTTGDTPTPQSTAPATAQASQKQTPVDTPLVTLRTEADSPVNEPPHRTKTLVGSPHRSDRPETPDDHGAAAAAAEEEAHAPQSRRRTSDEVSVDTVSTSSAPEFVKFTPREAPASGRGQRTASKQTPPRSPKFLRSNDASEGSPDNSFVIEDNDTHDMSASRSKPVAQPQSPTGAKGASTSTDARRNSSAPSTPPPGVRAGRRTSSRRTSVVSFLSDGDDDRAARPAPTVASEQPPAAAAPATIDDPPSST